MIMTKEPSALEIIVREIAQLSEGTPSLLRKEADKKLASVSHEKILESLDPQNFQYASEGTYVSNAIEGLVVHVKYDPLWRSGRLSLSLNTPYMDVRRDMWSEKITAFAQAIDEQYRRSQQK
mgnify:CR=1 FL=1